MKFEVPKHVVSQKYAQGIVTVIYSDASIKIYDAVKLGCDWFKMSNDTFFDLYGFNFNPHNVPGLYEKCRNIVYSA